MELTYFVIALLVTIVLSNVLDSAFPSIPLPLIQIGLGALIALTPLDIRIDLKPEIFMGVLIAPLLYREAEEADIVSLWRVRKTVIFLVFGLVFATVFVIGFSVSYFAATIPLAACFCLGGILGPTDPVAVKSVAIRVDIDGKVMSILKGESLINDASGVIAFNFAALALTTGAFSFGQASLSFIFVCVGGVVVGFAVGAAKNFIVRSLRRAQIQNAAAFVIIEILVPFLCFFIANALGVSGILAAVVAGTRQALRIRQADIFEARFTVIKNSFWDMISIIFNSFIFILLGLELPVIVPYIYYSASAEYTIGFAMGIGLLATGVMFAIRYIGITIAATDLPGESLKERMRNRAVLTLSGVKGTVSLATAFALPVYIAGGQMFEARELLLLITACAIISSLVIAIVLLPIIARPRSRKAGNEGRILLLKGTIDHIEKNGGDFNKAVVMRMKRQIVELELEDSGKAGMRRYNQIRSEFLETEMRVLEQKVRAGKYTKDEAAAYSGIFALINSFQSSPSTLRYRNRWTAFFRSIGANRQRKDRDGAMKFLERIGLERVEEIFWENTSAVIAILEKKYNGADEDLLSRVVEARISYTSGVISRTFGDNAGSNTSMEYNRGLRESYGIEREVLAGYEKNGLISEEEADDIRIEINMLENFTIEEMQDDFTARMILSGARRRRQRNDQKHTKAENKKP